MKVYIVTYSNYNFREKVVMSVHATRELADAAVCKQPTETLDNTNWYVVEMHNMEESDV